MNPDRILQGLLFPSFRAYQIEISKGLVKKLVPLGHSASRETLPVILPGFVDAHCHVVATGLNALKLDLSQAQTQTDVLDLLSYYSKERDGWIMAVNYDQNRWGGTHLTTDHLDQISSEKPILLRHSSGHAGVANSAALVKAGLNPNSADPIGGSFGRDSNGKLNGVLFENALDLVTNASPMPSVEDLKYALKTACQSLKRLGISAAADMTSNGISQLDVFEAYRQVQEEGSAIPIKFFVHWRDVFGKNAKDFSPYKDLIGGIKIFSDGAIGSATAAIYGNFSGAGSGGPIISANARNAANFSADQVSGQLIYSPQRLEEMITIADQNGYLIATHAIGDYASDLVMESYAKTSDPSRHRIEHAMILSDRQILRIKKIGCKISMQPEFLNHFSHAYRLQLGEESAKRLNRYRSVIEAEIPLSLSTDRPIVPGNPLTSIAEACNRPDGFDPSENISLTEAIHCWTSEASQMSGFSQAFGAIEEGTHAFFNIVSNKDDIIKGEIISDHWSIYESEMDNNANGKNIG